MRKSTKTLVLSLILLAVVSSISMAVVATAPQDGCGLVCRIINLLFGERSETVEQTPYIPQQAYKPSPVTGAVTTAVCGDEVCDIDEDEIICPEDCEVIEELPLEEPLLEEPFLEELFPEDLISN